MTEAETPWPSQHHLHEWPPRSKTRGQAAEVRFCTTTSLRLCAHCHDLFHQYRLRAVAVSRLGFDGPYQIQRSNDLGEWEPLIDRPGHWSD